MNKSSITFIIVFSLIFFNVPAVMANTWSSPTQAPPGGNTAEPLDVSSRSQTKAGALTLQSNFTVYDTDYNLFIDSTNNRIGIGTNSLTAGIKLEVRDNSSSAATLRITDTAQNPELQLQYYTGANDHWGIYVDKTDSNKLKIWGAGTSYDNRLTITTDGKVGINTVNPGINYKLDVNGKINTSDGLCIADDCKTSWSAVGGGNPSAIKETTGLTGIHNADFSSGGGGTNGWLGIKNFAESNGCSGTGWHICQSWEVSYIYSQGISTAGCNNTFSGITEDGSEVCLGWTIGPVAESTIETEAGFVEAGDCYGFKSSATDKYHSTVWYIDQWGAAKCSDELPVLCCQ